uniref:Uncharacterized protein n=1 Tax=Physcomitrium patens TaxID=3218 RepID=A0A2K1KBE2_PHYPA|nr:hypothetical protein PHYPA_010278 [Physcomitrium patens]
MTQKSLPSLKACRFDTFHDGHELHGRHFVVLMRVPLLTLVTFVVRITMRITFRNRKSFLNFMRIPFFLRALHCLVLFVFTFFMRTFLNRDSILNFMRIPFCLCAVHCLLLIVAILAHSQNRVARVSSSVCIARLT